MDAIKFPREIAKCPVCNVVYDESSFMALPKLATTRAGDLTVYWAECRCSGGVNAVSRDGHLLTKHEGNAALLLKLGKG